MTLDHDEHLDDLLRTLDPADDDLGPAARDRADALLERILGTTPIAVVAPRKRPRAPWIALGAAAAAFTIAAATLPSLFPSTPAYATWTPEPVPVTGATRDAAVGACEKAMAQSPGRRDEDEPLQPDPRVETARTVLAEQRGRVILVSLVTDSDSSYSCTFDADHPTRVLAAGGGIATIGTPPRPALGDTELRAFGWGMTTGPDWGFARTSGRVGSAVAGVTIRSGGTTLEASVADGVFAAWWPVPPRQDEPVIIDIRYDITLTDGSVRTAVDEDLGLGARPGPREIARVQRGGGAGPDGGMGTAGGLVGSEVVGVTVHADGQDTIAEVSDGTFRARWPLPRGTTKSPSATEPGPTTYTVALRDGTVLHDVRPVSGSGS